MRRWNLPIALYLFLVFVSGGVVGALAYRTYNPPTARSNATRPSRPEMRRQFMEEMRTRVNLTPDQQQKLSAIMDETTALFDHAHDTEKKEVERIREEHRAKVRALLTPEQLPKYEQLRQEREQRMKANKK